MRRAALILAIAVLSGSAFAQTPTINDVQLRPGSSSLWGAAFNVNNNQDISQYNTAGSTVDSFRWHQGSNTQQATQLFSMSTTGMVAGAAGSRMGAGTINATGFYVNGAVITPGGTPGGSSGQIQYNNAGAFGGFTTSGDATINTGTGALTLATVNSNVGTWGSATLCSAFTVNAKGLITAAAQSTCTPAIGSITGLGAGVATFLATPSSANLASAVTGETGTGALVFATSPTLVTPALGTPASGNASNLTALNATQLTTGTIPAARTNGHMNGTATNDNAAAGEVGEFMSNTAGAVALTTATTANVGQLTLTAGDWDVFCGGNFSGAGATVTSDVRLALNTVSATLPASAALQFFQYRSAGITDFIYAPTVGPWRVSITGASVTWFCVAQATFTTSTYGIVATIRARRMR